jgi:hypothetical protein
MIQINEQIAAFRVTPSTLILSYTKTALDCVYEKQ